MNCDYCLESITVDRPGITVVCSEGDEHKFHPECYKKANGNKCLGELPDRPIRRGERNDT